MNADERIEGLRNLREGYGTTSAAVGYWLSLHGEDIIEEYAAAVDALEQQARQDLGAIRDRSSADDDVCLECDEEREYGHDAECSKTLGFWPADLATQIREEIATACKRVRVDAFMAGSSLDESLDERAEAAEARLEETTNALRQIAENAEGWHGYLPESDHAPGAGHVRSLAVIASTARAALARAAVGGAPA